MTEVQPKDGLNVVLVGTPGGYELYGAGPIDHCRRMAEDLGRNPAVRVGEYDHHGEFIRLEPQG